MPCDKAKQTKEYTMTNEEAIEEFEAIVRDITNDAKRGKEQPEEYRIRIKQRQEIRKQQDLALKKKKAETKAYYAMLIKPRIITIKDL
jgi:hypothetical protein